MHSTSSTSENSPTSNNTIKSIESNGSLKTESNKRSYLKLKTIASNGEFIFPEKKNYHDDLDTIIQEKNMKYGFFSAPTYEVYRTTLIKESRNSLKLHYSKISPHGETRAQICIVHGLENHSGRFFTVIFFFYLFYYVLKARRVLCSKWLFSPLN